MHATDLRAARERRPSARCAGAWTAAAILVASLAGGCGAQQTPTPPTAASATPAAAAPAATPTSTPVARADTLRVGTPGGPVRDSWGGWAASHLFMSPAVYGYLYQFDTHFGVVPDLADGACFVPGADGTIIRCRIIETTFHDGTPLTAEDVAYSFRLFGRFVDYAANLKEVRVVDPRTVDFVLASADAAFLDAALPAIPIVPQHAVEASYAMFLAATKGDTAKSFTKLADTIDADLKRDPQVCSPHVDAVAALFEKLGVALYREDYVTDATGTFDACWYLSATTSYIHAAADALGKTGLDAVAAAYTVLSINFHPIGTGPYRFVSEDATGIHLEAFPGYQGGLAATRYLDFVHTADDGSDLLDGSVDIFQWAPHDIAFQAAAAAHGVRFATVLSTLGYYVLAFNVRPGRLFADLALRQALQLCVDLPRNVDAATGGDGTPVYGPVLPDSWAYDPDLPKPERDVAAARALIEGAGWQLGSDGVYAKDGVRLAARILARGVATQRIKMADLIGAQARDCGMDLQTLPLGEDAWITALSYPLSIPGTHTPWDLFLFGFTNFTDPSLFMFTSSLIPSAKNPGGYNSGGFSDAVVDRLDSAALSTYDQVERARLLRQEQEEIAAKLPWLFLWTDTTYDAVRSSVVTVDGPLDLTVPNWAVPQLSRMVVESAP
jgi:ABC-type transport system substrate-binding protein